MRFDDHRDHSLLILPLFHVNGIVVGTLSPLIAGGRATIAGRFSPKTFFDRVEATRATYFSAVPTMYTMLSDLPAEVRPTRPRSGSRSAARHRPASSCSTSLRLATASRSSRVTGCRGVVCQYRQPAKRQTQARPGGASVAGSDDSDRRRRRRGCSRRGGRRGSGAGAERHARLPEPPGGNRQDARRRLGCTPGTSGVSTRTATSLLGHRPRT